MPKQAACWISQSRQKKIRNVRKYKELDMNLGVCESSLSFEDFSLQNLKRYCIQSPLGRTFYSGSDTSLYKPQTNTLRILKEIKDNQNAPIKESSFSMIESQIQTFPISDSEYKLLQEFNSSDYHYSLIKSEKGEEGISLNLELLKREGFELNSFLDRLRVKKSQVSLFLCYHIYRLLNYSHLKIWGAPYALKPALYHSYDWKSERDGSSIKIIGGHPSLAINYASRIMDDLMKEKIFLFKDHQINPNYQTLGYYPFVGNISAPALSSKDWSGATSLSHVSSFKQELQEEYAISDTLFTRLFSQYGFSGTLKIVEIGQELNKAKRLTNPNFQKISEMAKRMQREESKPIEVKSEEGMRKRERKESQNIYTAAQVVFLIRYLGLTRLEDLIRGRWKLLIERNEKVEQIVKMGLRAMQEENEWKWDREQEEMKFFQEFKEKQKKKNDPL